MRVKYRCYMMSRLKIAFLHLTPEVLLNAEKLFPGPWLLLKHAAIHDAAQGVLHVCHDFLLSLPCSLT